MRKGREIRGNLHTYNAVAKRRALLEHIGIDDPEYAKTMVDLHNRITGGIDTLEAWVDILLESAQAALVDIEPGKGEDLRATIERCKKSLSITE